VLRNICFTGYRPIRMPKVWGKKVDFNLFVDAKGLDQAQALGLDLHSLAGDPNSSIRLRAIFVSAPIRRP